MSMTGSQIDTLLESQFDDPEAGTGKVLQVSGGFQYTWDAARPIGSKVDPASILIDGSPIDLSESYRVTVNSFLADGGDGFGVLTEGTDRVGGEIDLDALVNYFAGVDAVSATRPDRIRRVN